MTHSFLNIFLSYNVYLFLSFFDKFHIISYNVVRFGVFIVKGSSTVHNYSTSFLFITANGSLPMV